MERTALLSADDRPQQTRTDLVPRLPRPGIRVVVCAEGYAEVRMEYAPHGAVEDHAVHASIRGERAGQAGYVPRRG